MQVHRNLLAKSSPLHESREHIQCLHLVTPQPGDPQTEIYPSLTQSLLLLQEASIDLGVRHIVYIGRVVHEIKMYT